MSDFPIHSKKQNGFIYHNSCCKLCRKIQHKKRIKTNQKTVADLKKTLACAECGIADHRVLEFHHVDKSTKEDNVSSMIARGLKSSTILKEIKKCVCLCGNCHRILHHLELYT